MFKYHFPLFAPYWKRYLKCLIRNGYSRHRILAIVSHNHCFHRYLTRKKVQRLAQITPDILSSFLCRKQAQFRIKHGCPLKGKSLRGAQFCVEGFLTYAFKERGQHFHQPQLPPESRALPKKLLDSYLDFCRIHKGLKETTRKIYLSRLLQLASFLEHKGIREIRQVTLADLDAFFLDRAKFMSASSLHGLLSVLRSFFKYLHLDGKVSSDLGRDLAIPCLFRDRLRPKYLPWNKIQELLAGIDHSNLAGKRDYAILVLLACHGLRAREAANLNISDIDWGNQSFLLRERKDGTTIRLPLSQRAKGALQDYLSVRPACSYPEVFLTAIAPLKPLGASICNVARWHLYKRFGRSITHRGSHVLRHSFAKALLDRGARLPEIGALLGHRSLRSTMMYTRIATEDMREVADNYADFL